MSCLNTHTPPRAFDRHRSSLWRGLWCLSWILSSCVFGTAFGAESTAVTALGRSIFDDTALSRDGKVSCGSCHDPAHAFADARARSAGIDGQLGTRNAPSLVGIANDTSFFWDGRRTRLDEAVLDPFTNPVEMGLPSTDAVLERLRHEPEMLAKFRAAFPRTKDVPTLQQVQQALTAFVHSLSAAASLFDRAQAESKPLASQAEQGRRLFVGSAGCSRCHTIGPAARFTDEQFHHSGIGQTAIATHLPSLTHAVIEQQLAADALGPKVLADADWSALGRFAVSHKPADIGAFRTPSLRNVAATAPYMHDGSIATLSDAVDHEIYYHSLSNGHPTNLSQAERESLVAFLETLTDDAYGKRTTASLEHH